MVNNTNLSFGQKVDSETNMIMPWFTHGSLDEIKTWDLSGKNILMFGSGMGDAFLSHKCKKLVVVERNMEWLQKSKEYSEQFGVSAEYIYRPCNDSSGNSEYYLEIPNSIDFDIIINDDAYRTECCQVSVDYFKKRGGGILICDNYWQDYVWKSPIAIELLEPFEKHIHSQPDHTDYTENGCEWKTAIIFVK